LCSGVSAYFFIRYLRPRSVWKRLGVSSADATRGQARKRNPQLRAAGSAAFGAAVGAAVGAAFGAADHVGDLRLRRWDGRAQLPHEVDGAHGRRDADDDASDDADAEHEAVIP